MQWKTNSITWNRFCTAAVSCFKEKKNTAALPLVFRLKNSSHLPVYVDNKEEQERPRKAEQERAAAVWSDCQSSIEEVPNGPSGSQGRGSQAGGVSLNKTEFTWVQTLKWIKKKMLLLFPESWAAFSIGLKITPQSEGNNQSWWDLHTLTTGLSCIISPFITHVITNLQHTHTHTYTVHTHAGSSQTHHVNGF